MLFDDKTFDYECVNYYVWTINVQYFRLYIYTYIFRIFDSTVLFFIRMFIFYFFV